MENLARQITQKPKRSKSRNGCVTCKRKRVKCDETKPACLSCINRGFQCEGYRKQYYWRLYDKSNVPPSAVRRSGPSGRPRSLTSTPSQPSSPEHHSLPETRLDAASPSSIFENRTLRRGGLDPQEVDYPSSPSSARLSSPPEQSESNTLDGNSSDFISLDRSGYLDDLPALEDTSALFEADGLTSLPAESSGIDSPVVDGYGFDMCCFDDTQLVLGTAAFDDKHKPQQADTRMMCRFLDYDDWQERGSSPSSPAQLDCPTFSSVSSVNFTSFHGSDLRMPGTLGLLYSSRVFSHMSIKDGPGENPWRELLGPLASAFPALQSSICAIAAFHGRQDITDRGYAGLRYIRKALQHLSNDNQEMPLTIRLATILIINYSGWNYSIATGVQSSQSTQALVKEGLKQFQVELTQSQLSDSKRKMWRFLCNTHVYIVLMARLTSAVHADTGLVAEILDTVNQALPGELLQVDALLGCGVTIFVLFNRVLDLVQSRQRRDETTLSMLSQAAALSDELEQWQRPAVSDFEPPRDPNASPMHCIQTADAYRWSLLIYMGQSIPELPSCSAKVLARKILLLLASTPPTSGTMIIQCFPLLVAGCETSSEEDRAWVMERWGIMFERFGFEKIEACRKVTREVWRRSDLAQYRQRADTEAFSLQRFGCASLHEARVSARPCSLDIRERANPRCQVSGCGVEGFASTDIHRTIHWMDVIKDQALKVFLG